MKSLLTADDLAEMASLPEEVRQEVRLWVRVMDRLTHTPHRIGVAIQSAATELGVSAATVRRRYDAWRVSRSWHALVDRRRIADPDRALPAEFVEHWRGLCERNQRKCRPAYRALVRAWRGGAPIPGYPSSTPRTSLPAGWSYRNLMRLRPTDYELTAARVGRSAAAQHRPLVLTTRVGLRVGQFYLFDDLWHDHKVHVPGQRAARRPLEFHALDLFSACKIAWGIKAATASEETGKLEHLKEREFRFLLALLLSRDGYRADDIGTTMVVEHGTAAIRDDLEALLSDLTGGRIRVARSGIEGAAAFAGQFAGRGRGNFRFKAALESLGNLIHNELADVAGQVGRNRDNSPEELDGRERYHVALCRALATLPPERAALLRLPFLTLDQFITLVESVYERINSRTEHDLEGWDAAGLITGEWRLGPDSPWQSQRDYLALPPPARALVDTMVSCPGHARTRRLSPAEVWQVGKPELTKLPGHAIAMMLGRDLGREVAVQRGLFTFSDRSLAPDALHYEAVVDGRRLRDKDKYLVIANPLDLTVCHLLDARGRYVGASPRWERVSRADTDALHRVCGRAAKAESELLQGVRARGRALGAAKREMHQINAAVLAGTPLLEHEHRADERMRTGDPEEFLIAAPPAPPSSGDESPHDPIEDIL